MTKPGELPVLAFETPQSWEDWLKEHQADSPGIWLKIAKKEAGVPSVDYAQALEGALCYGWIDGQKAALDDNFWLQEFTPRRPQSKWSKINREKAEALMAAGRMQPAGLRQVELAKSDGRWEAAYTSQRQSGVPDDFQAALDQNPQAKEFFATLNSANRYAILYRLQTAKKAETRAAKIQKFIEMLNKHEKIYA